MAYFPIFFSMVPNKNLNALFVGQKFFLFIIISSLQLSFVRAHEKRCASCDQRNFEEYKNLRQQQILTDLLRKLELPAKPNVTVDYDNLPPIGLKNPKIKQLVEASVKESRRRLKRSTHFYEFEENSSDYFPNLYETDADAIPQTTFLPAQKPPAQYDIQAPTAFFDFSPSISRKLITHAALHVPVRRVGLDLSQPISLRIDIYERFYNGSLGDKVATKHEHVSADGDENEEEDGVITFKVNLDEIDVERWVNDRLMESKNFVGLFVKAFVEKDDVENLALHPGFGDNHGMFLEVEMIDGGSRNKRSHPNTCQVGGNETKCCLYDLVIDFEKAGWNFVIAPKRYNAYVCNGECSASQAGHRAQMAHSAKVDYYQCCHPKEYTGITIVYMTQDSNQIWVKEVPNMVARKCGCA